MLQSKRRMQPRWRGKPCAAAILPHRPAVRTPLTRIRLRRPLRPRLPEGKHMIAGDYETCNDYQFTSNRRTLVLRMCMLHCLRLAGRQMLHCWVLNATWCGKAAGAQVQSRMLCALLAIRTIKVQHLGCSIGFAILSRDQKALRLCSKHGLGILHALKNSEPVQKLIVSIKMSTASSLLNCSHLKLAMIAVDWLIFAGGSGPKLHLAALFNRAQRRPDRMQLAQAQMLTTVSGRSRRPSISVLLLAALHRTQNTEKQMHLMQPAQALMNPA